MKKLILASASPRRRELLKMIAPDGFEIASGIEVDETYPADMAAEQVPVYLSALKAEAYKGFIKTEDDVLITADTVVIIDGIILGKPGNRAEAISMLERLAGRDHTVITGVTLTTAESSRSFDQHTSVHFDTLDRKSIEYYVDNYAPYDKAGAYGIQEWIGAAAIKGIEGSFYNVMGLPVHRLFIELQKI
ncbi:MAG: Maf family nucleotide pyrophosphatase [Odoribacter sp.]|nr:Maf family nucleotide pyrophosphatase [Odoribacter sp.]